MRGDFTGSRDLEKKPPRKVPEPVSTPVMVTSEAVPVEKKILPVTVAEIQEDRDFCVTKNQGGTKVVSEIDHGPDKKEFSIQKGKSVQGDEDGGLRGGERSGLKDKLELLSNVDKEGMELSNLGPVFSKTLL